MQVYFSAGDSGFSEGIVVSSGVPACCAQGNLAARLALYHIFEKSHGPNASTKTSQWADVVAQRTQTLLLVQDLEDQRLAFVAKQVVAQLARHVIRIQCACVAGDLGPDVSGAAKPTRRTMSKRWWKAEQGKI